MQRRCYLLPAIFIFAIDHVVVHAAADQGSRDGEWRQGYLEGALASNPYLRDSRIHVVVEENRIRLAGSATSLAAKALAEQIALNAPGIEAVENRLNIVPVATEADGFEVETEAQRLANVPINNKVLARLSSHAGTKDLNISTETRSRIVVVRGEVRSETEKELVYWLVKNTDGVMAVVDRLEIIPPPQIQAGL